jgi:hypothetical protein
MLRPTFTPADIPPVLGQIDRAIYTATTRTDAALNLWQGWSDRRFGTIQPHILAAIEALAFIAGWAAVMAWGYSRLACVRTWRLWLESAPQRARAVKVMGQHYDTARYWLSVAYSAVAVAVAVVLVVGAYIVGSAPRWTGRAIAFALCVE